MKPLLLVAAGGALGASARHLVSVGALRLFGPGWPVGTFAANILGGLLMGLLVGWLTFAVDGGRETRLFLATGVLGGFTTFSAFALETGLMIERKAFAGAALYAGLSVAGSVGALFAGLYLARRLFA
ncbi:MAG: fluoride efflux transporter CrcB [Caulobacterales bacterium]|nr:fluoride efflux transporter CrcB [Caulobacterales bacterium]